MVAAQPNLVSTGNELVDYLESKQMEPMDMEEARKGERLAQIANLIYFFCAVILVPFTLFGTGYIFSKSFFVGWAVVAFLWVWVSMFICVVYPVVCIPHASLWFHCLTTINRSRVGARSSSLRKACGKMYGRWWDIERRK